MAKSYPFSIYLLKEGYDADSSLVESHGLDEVNDASDVPENSRLFLGDRPPTQPWWKSFLGIDRPLNQSLKSALLFIPVEEKQFVLSFGHAYSKLDDNSYEYDFGLRVTLNSIHPENYSPRNLFNMKLIQHENTLHAPIHHGLWGYHSAHQLLNTPPTSPARFGPAL